MKSRITIDVDYENQPIIKIEWNHSEDVRDKLVKRFLEQFGTESTFAQFYYTESQGEGNRTCEIKPIESDKSKPLSEIFYKKGTPKNKYE